MMIQTATDASSVVLGSEPLGRGGEGSVFEVKEHSLKDLPAASELVAKIYHNPDEENRLKKIVAMIRNTPESDSLAWPLALILDNGKFKGYVMKKLAKDSYRMWAEFAHAQQRRESAELFDVRYALTASLNLAIALSAVHEVGHMVGDINESNIFIGNDASVLLVDTDSAQIKNKNNVFPCLVGKPEYTAPELSHGALKNQTRTEQSEMFAYAVAIYQLLTGGAHPTDGIFTGEDDPPSVVEKIRAGDLPNFRKTKDFKEVKRVPTKAIPSRLKDSFIAALDPEPSNRPSFYDFEESLDDVLDNLVRCSKVKQHWYDKRDKKCGWCQHVKEGQPDPWVKVNKIPKNRTQKTLPGIKFNEGKKDGSYKAPRIKASALNNTANSSSAPSNNAGGRINMRKSNNNPGNNNISTLTQPLSQVYQSKRIKLPKNKKGKTLLQYVDGSSRERPPILQMAGSRPKLAYECFVNEIPDSIRFSWYFNDKIPEKKNLFISIFIGVLIALSWFITVPLIFDSVPKIPFVDDKVINYITLASVGTSLLGVLLKALFTFGELYKISKISWKYNFAKESSFKTIKVFPIVAIFYGPIFLFVAAFMIIVLIISFIGEVAKQ